MSEPMTLRDEDVGRIGEYVKPWLREIVSQLVPKPEFGGIGPELLERMVRVEEELKTQRELMDERFAFTERRFEAIDQRFGDLSTTMNQRFEAQSANMNQRFESQSETMNRRFLSVDQRFEDLIRHMDNRFNTLTWMIGIGFVVITSLTTVFALLT